MTTQPFVMRSRPGFCIELLRKFGMKQVRPEIGKAIELAQHVRDIHPQRNFDTLQRIQCQKAKLLIENVEIHGVLKTGPVLE